MDLRKDADRMAVSCQDTGFCDRVALFINVFCNRTFRAVSDKTEGLEFTSIGFDNVTVIDVYDRFIGNAFTDICQGGFQKINGNSFA